MDGRDNRGKGSKRHSDNIFCTTRTRNTQLQDTKMLGGVKRKSEKEREERMLWETIWKYDTCSKALYSVLSEE